MGKCKHENVSFHEVIPAIHQRNFEGDEYFCNNEYSMIRIKAGVKCLDCGTNRTITYKNMDKQPEWIKRRIKIMKSHDEWFF